MLHELIEANRDDLIARARDKVAARVAMPTCADDLRHGVPLFLDQLAATLGDEARRGATPPGTTQASPAHDHAIGVSAGHHGRELLARGYNVSQVVHGYGDVCQAITELAVERDLSIPAEEFHTLNRCLDVAIAESVTEYARSRDEGATHLEAERLGQVVHELRNKLHTALLSFNVLKTGRVGISGNTGAVLGRSLAGLGDLIDAMLAEVRLSAKELRRNRVALRDFLADLAVTAGLHAEYRGLQLVVEPADAALIVEVDQPTLASAMMNLLQNAYKFTRRRGRVVLRARREGGQVFIEVEDQCGGLVEPEGAEPHHAFATQRHPDQSGLGLGLSIARKAARANGGELHSRSLPGIGCVFAVELPLAPPAAT